MAENYAGPETYQADRVVWQISGLRSVIRCTEKKMQSKKMNRKEDRNANQKKDWIKSKLQKELCKIKCIIPFKGRRNKRIITS